MSPRRTARRPPTPIEKNVEVVARRASERLAMLRAFEVSQTQANSDSLTGLMTRRSLETAVRELHATGTSYSVAYGDLDHFKTSERHLRPRRRRPRAAHLLPGAPGLAAARRHPGPLRRRGVRHRPPRLPGGRGAPGARTGARTPGRPDRRRGRPAVHRQFRARRPPTRAGTSTTWWPWPTPHSSAPRPAAGTRSSSSEGPAPPAANPSAASVRLEPRPRTNGESGRRRRAGAPAQQRMHSLRLTRPQPGGHRGVAQRRGARRSK